MGYTGVSSLTALIKSVIPLLPLPVRSVYLTLPLLQQQQPLSFSERAFCALVIALLFFFFSF
jgi:hypothetical protein